MLRFALSLAALILPPLAVSPAVAGEVFKQLTAAGSTQAEIAKYVKLIKDADIGIA